MWFFSSFNYSCLGLYKQLAFQSARSKYKHVYINIQHPISSITLSTIKTKYAQCTWPSHKGENGCHSYKSTSHCVKVTCRMFVQHFTVLLLTLFKPSGWEFSSELPEALQLQAFHVVVAHHRLQQAFSGPHHHRKCSASVRQWQEKNSKTMNNLKWIMLVAL